MCHILAIGRRREEDLVIGKLFGQTRTFLTQICFRERNRPMPPVAFSLGSHDVMGYWDKAKWVVDNANKLHEL